MICLHCNKHFPDPEIPKSGRQRKFCKRVCATRYYNIKDKQWRLLHSLKKTFTSDNMHIVKPKIVEACHRAVFLDCEYGGYGSILGF